MLFRRNKKKQQQQQQQRPDEKRGLYRQRSFHLGDLSARLRTASGGSVRTDVADLTIRGIGLRMALEVDPEVDLDQLVDLEVSHGSDGWRIATPARCRQRHEEGERVLYGFEFINRGDLYSQMEDAFGRYFNRRRARRARLDLDAQPIATIAQKRHRVRGPLHDVSVGGIQVALSRAEAVALEDAESVHVRFELPGVKGALEGAGTLKYRNALGALEIVGVELDMEAASSFARRRDEIATYVEERLRELQALGLPLRGAGWHEGAPAPAEDGRARRSA